MKKQFLSCLLTFLLLLTLPVCAAADASTLAQLNDPSMTVGLSQGSAAELVVRQELPKAKIAYFSDNQAGYLAIAQGKIDAFVYDYNQMRIAIENGISGVYLLGETLGEPVRIAVGISPVSRIPNLENKLNQFIGQLRAEGTLDDMFLRWVIDGDEAMPEIPAPENPSFTLVVGTSGIVPPYSYYVGTELAGYDIELAYRLAAWLGADLQFKVYDYGAIIPAAVSGDVDCIMADLNITAERAEALPFSDVLFEERLGIVVPGETARNETTETHAWQAYNGKPLGVLVGPLMEDIAHEYFPDSEYLLMNGYPDCIAALLTGKIDGYLGDEVALKAVIAEQPTITYIPEYLTYNEYNFAFRKNDPASDALREELNAWLSQSWADGTMQEIDSIWFGTDEARKTVDLPGSAGENGTIRVVTTSTDMPFSYIKDGQNVGYDIDVVARFCRDRSYGLELVDVDFAARIPTLQSGKADFTTSMNVTPERMEEVNFCDLVSSGGIVLAVRAKDLESADPTAAQAEDNVPEFTSFSDLNGKRVSMLNGAPFEELVRSKASKVAEFTYFNNIADIILALQSGKTDAILTNNAVAQLMVNRNHDLALFPESLQESGFGFAFAKGASERETWQAAYDALPEDTLERIWSKWTSSDENGKVLPAQDWPGLNGTVKVAACDTLEPMSYAGAGGELMGFDIEVILMLAKELDVHVEFTGMEFSSILSAVQSGKVDFGTGSIVITDERKESVDFVEYHPAAFVLVVRKAQGEKQAIGAQTVSALEETTSFWGGLQSSFNKTFLRENRWKLFTQGIGNTLLITVLSILFGTLLGFLLFMLCRNGNAVANGIANFCLWLVQGTPGVVLLMILYYIIFGRVAISGLAVAVIGFTLTFGAAVFGLLKMGVGTIDRGQYEAAYALGHSNRHTFFKIILPQAIPHVLPAYQGEIVGLIKATAIVGYIAVQDLTKMGDIVRSRTYEAFFPLIAVTIIYFVLEGLFSFAVSRIRISIDPKRRKRETILKGVDTHD